jgi:DNA polymerase-3 subunit gamma/tau
MSYTALARKWRPRSFQEMAGQQHVLRALTNALDSGRIHHAFLFTGTRGVGKTTVARLFAKALNCERGVSSMPCGVCSACTAIDAGRFVDLIEVDAASRTKVDDTRELLDNVQYLPSLGRFKVYLIDEVHMLTNHSFNALLKTLEEPPEHVKFLLATTDPQKLPVTVLSRCLQFNLSRLPTAVIGARLTTILEAEGVAAEPAGVQLIARAGDGSLRDALSLLDQLLAFAGGAVTEVAAQQMLGTVDRQQVAQVARRLAARDGAGLLRYAQEMREWSVDPAQVLEELATLFTQVALRQVVADAPPTDEDYAPELIAELAAGIPAEDLQVFYQIALLGRRDLVLHTDPAVGFVMTLLRMLAFQPGGSGGGTGTAPAPAAARAAAQGAAPATAPAGPAGGVPAASIASAAGAGAASLVQGVPLDAAHWAGVVASLELAGAARQLAANCVFLRREGALVYLALDPAKRVLQSRALEDKLAQALTRAYGTPLRLSIELVAAAADTPARAQLLKADAELQSARESLAADPAVRALQERFGGSMLADSVRLTRNEEG